MKAAWFAEPGSVVGLVVLAGAYVAGTKRVRRSGARIGWFRPAMFVLGWSLLAIALVSPLHPASEMLVSAHMAQHTLLILAPLALVAGRTGTRLMQAFAPTYRTQLLQRFKGRVPRRFPWWTTLTVTSGTILVWHVPGIFEVATDVPVLHAVEHVSLIAISTLYWNQIVTAGRRADVAGEALASLTILFIGGAATGALLTFSAVAWYPDYVGRAAALGIEWSDDQQMAGVVMSVPMGVVTMGVAAWLGWRWSGAMGLSDRTTVDAITD